MAGIDAAVDRSGEHDTAPLLEPHEAIAPGGIVGGEVGAGDSDQAVASGQARERGGVVATGGVGDPSVNMRRDHVGRVHAPDARTEDSTEEVRVGKGGGS